MQHPERVLDRLVVRAADRDPLPAHAVAIAVFAKKHAVPEAFLHPGDLGREMENAGREEETIRPVGGAAAAEDEPFLAPRHAFDFVVRELDLVPLRLAPAVLEQLFAADAVREAEIIPHLRFPFRHGVAGIDHERVAFGAPEINRGREPRDPAADDDRFAALRIVEVFVFDHEADSTRKIAARSPRPRERLVRG